MTFKKACTVLVFAIGFIGISQDVVSRDWTSFVQTIEVSTDKAIKFRVVGAAKTIGDTDNSWSGIWARVDNKDDEQGFFDNMGDRPIVSNEWNSYTVEGEMGKNAERISFGGLCLGNGTFYFDKFEVFTEKADGSFEKLEIKNPSFEKEVKGGTIPSWRQGIINTQPVSVKEFSVTSSKDTFDGAYSLMITGSGIVEDTSDNIGPKEGFTPQIGTLISMLDNLSVRVERTVGQLDERELDYLMDDKANSIGALIMHLIATEVVYQEYTFEDISYSDEEKAAWQFAMQLGNKGRENIKGHKASYYFDIWKKVRAKTKEEMKKKDDEWLAKDVPGAGISHHYAWFHVMEHQSSHLGQMLLISKRIPSAPKPIDVKDKIKD